MKSDKVQTIVLGIIFLFGACALFDHFVFISVHVDDVMLRHSFWLSSLAYGGMLALGIVGLRARRVLLLGASTICGLAFLVSLHSIVINLGVAQVREYYAGGTVRLVELEKLDDFPYCVNMSRFRLEINNGKGQPQFVAYRGVWPVYFSDAEIEKTLLPLGRCAF